MKRRRFYFGLATAALVACGIDVAGVDPTPSPPTADAGFEANLPPPSTYDATPACPNTTTDGENCGECGHSCAGAVCANSMCVPEQLLTGMNDPFAVVLKDGVAYVAEHTGGRIFRTPVDAGTTAVTTPLFDTGKAPRALDVSSDRLFWVEQAMVRSILLDGGSPDGTSLGDTGTAVVVLGVNIAFTDFNGGRVVRRTLGFAEAKTIGADAPRPFGLAVDNDYIYWTSNVPNGAIRRFARTAGNTEEPFLANEDRPSSVVLGALNLFWTTPTAVRFAPLDGGAAGDLFANRDAPTSIIKDGPYLYWIEPRKGWIVRGRNDGSPPIVLAAGETQSEELSINNGITVDDRFVYWISTTNGTLKRTAK